MNFRIEADQPWKQHESGPLQLKRPSAGKTLPSIHELLAMHGMCRDLAILPKWSSTVSSSLFSWLLWLESTPVVHPSDHEELSDLLSLGL